MEPFPYSKFRRYLRSMDQWVASYDNSPLSGHIFAELLISEKYLLGDADAHYLWKIDNINLIHINYFFVSSTFNKDIN